MWPFSAHRAARDLKSGDTISIKGAPKNISDVEWIEEATGLKPAHIARTPLAIKLTFSDGTILVTQTDKYLALAR